MNRLFFLLPLLLFAAMAGYFFVRLGDDASVVPSALIDKPVPQIDAPPLIEGKSGIKTADFTGEVKVLNVWASWCVPCRAEHPLVSRLAQTEGVPVYGLNWKDKKQDAVAWLNELGDPYAQIGFDESGRNGIELGVYGVPETYIIDKDGRIRYKRVGPLSPTILKDEVLPLIRELKQ